MPTRAGKPISPGSVGAYSPSKLTGARQVGKALEHNLIMRTTWPYSPWGVNFAKTPLPLAGQRNNSISVADGQRAGFADIRATFV